MDVLLSFTASLFNLWNKNYPFVKQLLCVGPLLSSLLCVKSLSASLHSAVDDK